MSESALERMGIVIEQADALPYGDVKTQLYEEAVRLADSAGDQQAMFEARMLLVHAAVFAGAVEKMMVAFAWCLAQYEANPDEYRFWQRTLLWEFKNILHDASELPHLSVAQFDDLRAQMASLYRRSGHNMRPVHYLRFVFAINNGDRQMASEMLGRFQSEPRDSMADCQACEGDAAVEYYDLMDEPEKALDAAQPSLTGRWSCAEVPHRTFAYVLRPLVLLNRIEEADKYQSRGYRMIRGNPAFFRHVALHITYLAHRDRLRAAANMFERHLPWALKSYALRSKHSFYAAALGLMGRLKEQRPTHVFRFPQDFPLYHSSSDYDVAALIDWLTGQERELAERFDARNGSDFFSRELVQRLAY